MTDEPLAKTRVRCPKCKSGNLTFIEVSTWETMWEVTDGQFDLENRLGNPGHIERVEVECRDCKHHWKPRGAWQVDNLIEE